MRNVSIHLVFALVFTHQIAWNNRSIAADDPVGNVKSALDGPFVPPAWLADTPVPFTPDELTETNRFGLTIWAKLAEFEAKPDRFHQAIATVHEVATRNDRPEFIAKCDQMLGFYYEGMLQDSIRAFHWYRQLSLLSGRVGQIHDPQNHNMRDTKRLGVLGMARCYASLGLTAEADSLLRTETFRDWRELFDLAVIYRILKDTNRSNAAIVAGIAAGRANAMQRLAATSRGILLLWTNGDRVLIRKHLPHYFSAYEALVRQQNGKPLPEHLVALHTTVQTIDQRLDELDTIPWSMLRDGTYTGQSAGYNGTVSVSVRLSNGRMERMNVTDIHEKRCFNARQVVSRELIERQSLDVDAVTGATITSQAICNAVRNALTKARR